MNPKDHTLVKRVTPWNSMTGGQMFVNSGDRISLGLATSKDVREWLYTFGIQPDSYMFKKFGANSIEIRFCFETDYALVKLGRA
tara:strand:- start:8766 stop:9017 length:252 start_codon:yes stop_codon:yes gene_type:complete